MTVVETSLPGLLVLQAKLVTDERGFFARLYDEEDLSARGVDTRVAQSRVAFNKAPGTLRGLHFQAEPYGETKIVRCTAGSIFDIVADLRATSPTRYRWEAFELSAANRTSLLVPPGCAHGYMTLTAGAEVSYLISAPYMEPAQRGVRWDDPTLD
ncbi:MAG: dTDP-4-dehydrorhamnose 3,5-epimerase family protein, partial [Acidimicrobiales bacterium]